MGVGWMNGRGTDCELRPQNRNFRARRESTGDPDPGTPTMVRNVAFRGVRDVAFRCRGYDHVVELAGRHRLIGVFHPLRHERGREVCLQIDAAGCIVFPDEETPEGHPGSRAAADAEAASGIVTVAAPTRWVAGTKVPVSASVLAPGASPVAAGRQAAP